jgi:DNA-binding MarR family transcriptional regulator
MAVDRAHAVEDVRAALRELLAAQRRLRGREAQRPPALSFSQYPVLRVLADGGEHSSGELATAADVTPAAVTKLLDGLERVGVVERVRGDADRRRVGVRITDAGRGALATKDAELRRAWEDKLVEADDAEIASIAAALRRVAGVFDAF